MSNNAQHQNPDKIISLEKDIQFVMEAEETLKQLTAAIKKTNDEIAGLRQHRDILAKQKSDIEGTLKAIAIKSGVKLG